MTVIEQQSETRPNRTGAAVADRPVVRLGWLDALRGIAALLVAVHHFRILELIPGGTFFTRNFDLGIYSVMLFFLVSGYIVPASLERRGDVRGFWIGRIFRIYPLLIVVIAVSLIVLPAAHSAVPDVVVDHPVRSTLANALLMQEVLNVPSAIGVMWTLSYEMVFYFFVTALFVIGRHRLSAQVSLFFAAVGLLFGGAVASQLITADRVSTRNLILACSVVMVMGLFCVLSGRKELTRVGALLLGGLGLVLMLTNARAPFFETMVIFATMFAGTAVYRIQNHQGDRLVGLLCCGFVLVAGLAAGYMYNRGPARHQTWTEGWVGFVLPYFAAWLTFGIGMLLRGARFPRVLTWLGAISYSVYVTHVPVLHGVRWMVEGMDIPKSGPGKFIPTVIFLALVFLMSHLTYKLVELPGQRLGKRLLTHLARRRGDGSAHVSKDASGVGEPSAPRYSSLPK
ncbi:acyltransferase family protein [Streptomyces sp. NPDC058623]|uniref:acyltransferase family protein n=1 Tax=Streptomyces sp. NPDC058623 TaxID=3346563 RepID=UPI00365BCA73